MILQYLTYNIRLRQNPLSHYCNREKKYLCRNTYRKGTQFEVGKIQNTYFR